MMIKTDASSLAIVQFSDIEGPRMLTRPGQISQYITGLSSERIYAAESVARVYRFKLPYFYAKNILSGASDDPLLDLVFPTTEELEDGDELWDTTSSSYKASDSPYWVQKYQYQGLIRVTTACSGQCRFCYVKKRNALPRAMTTKDVDRLFDDLEARGESLREIILSGGDPLCAPSQVLEAIASRMSRLRAMPRPHHLYINIHTREPVWNPASLLRRHSVLRALGKLSPKIYVINVIHPREVTSEFVEACNVLSEASGSNSRPVFLCQHPLFRGVNDRVEILDDLYSKLIEMSTPILPYYLVHPFYNGTLPKHRLSIVDSQNIYRELVRRPGCLTPQLVIPTPWGKCHLGPDEKLIKDGHQYLLTTKDGNQVLLP